MSDYYGIERDGFYLNAGNGYIDPNTGECETAQWGRIDDAWGCSDWDMVRVIAAFHGGSVVHFG